ncbi:male-specific lethal 1 homolog isoform X2 [Lytechinus pictus]|uniref:male-specific lethal 1 homolog isoform X2 n=1 Tax=Lytechinus pictus TaxID=7653 RepID=UPI0030B9AE79
MIVPSQCGEWTFLNYPNCFVLQMSSYFRNVFLDIAAAFSPMAPGNMKSEFIGLQRSKLTGKSYATRKLYLKNSDGSSNENVSLPVNMDDQHRDGHNNAADNNPSVVLNASALAMPRDVIDNTTKPSDNPNARSGDGGCAAVAPTSASSPCKVNAESEISHLKVLSMLHLDVIEQQQKQIQMVEREAQRLRLENETLKCRLERMNRRTHLSEKVEPQTNNNNNHRPIGRPRKILDSPVQKKKRKSELDVSINSTGKQSIGRGVSTPIKDNNGNLNSSISSVRSTNTELSKKQRRAEKLAKKEEKKSTGRQDSKESKDDDKFHRTEVMYPCLSDLRVPQTVLLDEESVMVPSWRVINIPPPSTSSDAPEECSDAVFEQRHSKLEQDERKRKRWDIQRIRELREHERLVNKQKQREYAQWEHILTTFYPGENDAEYIEMSDTIPVITFGVQVPTVKPSEFELPWFDAKQRERDEQRRQTRRMTSRR